MAVLARAQFTLVDMADMIITSATAPTNPVINQLWLDTSVTPNVLKRWTGSEWEVVQDAKIGGTNLLPDSCGDQKTWGTNAYNWYNNNGYSGKKAVGVTRGGYAGSDRAFTARSCNLSDLTAGTKYTLSGWYIVTTALSAENNQIFVRIRDSGYVIIKDMCSTTIPSNTPIGEWVRFSITDTLPANTATAQVNLALDRNGAFKASRLMFEVGDKATDWTPAPEDPATSVSTTTVDILPDGMYVKSTGVFEVQAGASVRFATDDLRILDSTGDRELLTIAPDGVRVDADVLAAPNISGNVPNTFAGGTIPWKGSPQASLNSIGKHLMADSTLTIPAGNYPGFTAQNFKGARLNIKMLSGTRINGVVIFRYCDDVNFYADAINTAYIIPVDTVSASIVYVQYCARVAITRINLSGVSRTSAADGTQNGLQNSASTVLLTSCSIDKTGAAAVRAEECSRGYFNSCQGGVVGGSNPSTVANLGRGVRSMYGSFVSIAGTTFAAVNGDEAYRATLITDAITPTGSAGTTPTTAGTKTYAVSAGYTAKATSSGGSSVSWSSGEPRQGSWTERTWYDPDFGQPYYVDTTWYGFGLLLLSGAGNIVSDRPSGKTIASARMTVRRDASAGTSGTISCTLYMHNLTSAPSGAPNTLLPTAAASAVSIAPGEEVTITLNAAAIAALNNGTCKGFGWRAIGGYGRYDIYGELEVTYSL